MSDLDCRFLLARYTTGGVVVDLESGNYYRVNSSAAMVCDALCAGGDVDGRVAAELGIPREEAARIVAEVESGLAAPAVHGTPQGSYHFYPTVDGYLLRHGERTVLEVDGASLDIRLPAGAESPVEPQLELYVRALAPKLLFQRRVTVLHASACLVAGKLIAFAGLSGAGKTTTARAFTTAGARLISEDLVVLQPEARQGEVLLEAEPLIQEWARRTSGQLLSEPRKPASSDSLEHVLDGPTALLDQVLFLDKSRRTSAEFATSALAEPDALTQLIAHNFLGAVEPETWKRYFNGAVELLQIVDFREVSTPDGLDRLASAATRYISSTAS
jgi:hypothetical protein